MKKIIILGAGIYQVPLIKAAKKRGLYVIVVSIPGDYPGFAIADRVYYVNTTDRQAVLDIALKEKISAIVTTGTDVAVSTIGYVCDRMGLCGISERAAGIVTDKALMKQAFREGGVSTSDFYVVHSLEEALIAYGKLKAPVMLKIVDKSGSRGITKVESEDMLREAYGYAADMTGADHMILEKYVEGTEIGVDAFVSNGEVKLIVPHDKLIFKTKRTGIPMGHICPTRLSEEICDRLSQEMIKIVRSTGMDNCAVNSDVFITDDGQIYVIEAAGRCGATGIPEVISGYAGVDYYDMILACSLGEDINKVNIGSRQTETRCSAASVLIHSDRSGVLENIRYMHNNIEYNNRECIIDGDCYITLDYEPGDNVHEFENGTHRIGQAVFYGNTRSEVMGKVENFRNSLAVAVR